MKQPLLLLILAVLTYFYFQRSAPPDAQAAKTQSAPPLTNAVAAHNVISAPAPASYDRWKTGPTAQNDWKTGPNAQTDFQPFAPSEHAKWNQTPGYTIVSGAKIRK